jgi:hypothetical protein
MKNRSTLFRLMLATIASAPLLLGQNAGADPAGKVEVITSDQKVNYQGEGGILRSPAGENNKVVPGKE